MDYSFLQCGFNFSIGNNTEARVLIILFYMVKVSGLENNLVLQ